MHVLILSLLMACGPKTPPENPVADAAPPPPPPAAVEAEPEPEPEPEPPKEVVNADLTVTITSADGTVRSGHVKRIERSEDWFGEAGWSTDPGDLVVSGESSSGAMKNIKWTEIKQVTVVPGKVPADVDCFYDSDWSPWMYDCTLKTRSEVQLKDSSTFEVTNRHKWRLTFDDGTSAEFWLWKHPAREQDSEVVGLDSGNPENYDLYTKLQNRLREEASTSIVTKVVVQ